MKNKEQQKLLAIFIFALAVIGLSKGLENLDQGLNFLNGIMIIGGFIGVTFSIIAFFQAK